MIFIEGVRQSNSYLIVGSLGILQYVFELSPTHCRLISFQVIAPEVNKI